MQDALARAHAQIASARAYAYTTVSDLWAVLVAGASWERGSGRACGS
ncbi:hypothetical protein AB0D65_22065 [Streptomyces griseoloalbus]|uniref:Uncharacterized protein n=1 Tax=Streptomyces griseoloalbus TaxID=67303 RepID=A0ABV3E8Y1_9ACTN